MTIPDSFGAKDNIPIPKVMTYSGLPIPAGTLILWEGEAYRAKESVWDRAEDDPASAPTKWEKT